MTILPLSLKRREAAKVRFHSSRAGMVLILLAMGLFPGSAVPQQGSSARPTTTVVSAPATPAPKADNPPTDIAPADSIGTIEGDSIAVTGPMSVEVVHGQVKTILRSGSDVRVKSGTARIDLIEGGLITICGPAHFSVLKAAGALTVALDTGTIHAHVQHSPILSVYTAQIKASPLSIGEEAQDLLVGFASPGAMCVRTTSGAVRLEQQLSGQSVVIPQSGDVLLMNGQLDALQTSSGRCLCELGQLNAPPEVQTQAPAPAEVSRLASAEDIRKRTYDAKPTLPPAHVEKAVPKDEPIYQVIVPPLVYLANAKVQPEIDPAMIILVRRVRVRPTVIFQGRVLDEPASPPRAANVSAELTPASPVKTTPASASPDKTKPTTPPPPPPPGVVDRVKTFFHNLWSKSP